MYLQEVYNYFLKKTSLPKGQAKQEIRLLIQHVLKYTQEELIVNLKSKIELASILRLYKLIKLRDTGYPLAYILGYKPFWNHNFKVNPSVLIPRCDTEILVEAVLSIAKHSVSGNNILDLGTGSGCIILSLLQDLGSNSCGVGVDISNKALATAKENAIDMNLTNKVTFIQSNLFCNLKNKFKKFNIIVSNPPYIDFEDTHLDANVKQFEPNQALFAKQNGLEFYNRIFHEAMNFLTDDGIVALEVGYNQSQSVINLAKSYVCYKHLQTIKDYAGIERVVIFTKQ